MRESALPDGWVVTRLGHLLKRRRERPGTGVLPRGALHFAGLDQIDAETGALIALPLPAGELPPNSASIFHAGDILISRVCRNANRVALASADGVCTTDIWVLQPSAAIDPGYAELYLRSEEIAHARARLCATSKKPMLNWTGFAWLEAALPPIEEQRRIAAVLRRSEEFRRKRLRAEESLKQLRPKLHAVLPSERATQAIALADRLEARMHSSSEYARALFQSLLTQAITGQLTAEWRQRQAMESVRAAPPEDTVTPAVDENVVDKEQPPVIEDTLETRLDRGIATEADLDAWRARMREAMPHLLEVAAGAAGAIIGPTAGALAAAAVPILLYGAKAIINYRSLVDAEIRQTIHDNLRDRPEAELRSLQELSKSLETLDTAALPLTTGDPEKDRQVLQIISQAIAEIAPGRDPADPNYFLLRALSQEQYELYLLVKKASGYVVPENLSVQAPDPVASLRGLQLLAHTGLIQAVSLLRESDDPNAPATFLPAFRALQPDDEGLADLAPAPPTRQQAEMSFGERRARVLWPWMYDDEHAQFRDPTL